MTNDPIDPIDEEFAELVDAGEQPDLDQAVTAPDGSDQAVPADGSDELAEARQRLAERTEDLQRLQAEYVNYKRRVDRDRDVARQSGIEAVALDLLPVLDSIDMARQHDELTGGFKLVADELAKLATKYGLEPYGAVGDPFDPQLHEALMAQPGEPGQTEARCAMVMQRGYTLKGRIVRYARVAVSEPDPSAPHGADNA